MWAAIAAALAMVACAPVLDVDRVADEVRAGLDAYDSIEVAAVECPQERFVEPGDRFECTTTTATGAVIRIEVEQVSGDGDLRVAVVSGLIDLDEVTAQIERGLADEGLVATVDCTGATPAHNTGGRFTCAAHHEEGTGEVTVTVVDDRSGDVRWEYRADSDA